MVYTAGTLALAALEVLVHVDHDIAPTDLAAIPIEIPKRVRIERIEIAALPPHWRATPAPEQLQQLGTAWARRGAALLLRVPSALIPEEYNYLVNPAHSAVKRLRVGEPRPFIFDLRLFSSPLRS
jgi:RES domain-containing protein